MTNIDVLEFALPRIALAVACGLMVGLERERRHAAAGIKTQILICVGACIYTICSILFVNEEGKGDPARMVAQIVSGVGFLGAGTILRGTSDKIFGLTTAAMIWLCAGLGIMVGMGYGYACLVVTFIVITVIEAVSQFEKKFVRRVEPGHQHNHHHHKHGHHSSEHQLALVHSHDEASQKGTAANEQVKKNQAGGNEEAV